MPLSKGDAFVSKYFGFTLDGGQVLLGDLQALLQHVHVVFQLPYSLGHFVTFKSKHCWNFLSVASQLAAA